MAKTGVKEESWESVTNGVATSTTNINPIKKLTFKTTDLSPFTSFNTILQDFNQSLKSLQAFTKVDSQKMKEAANRKVQDDQKEAHSITSNLGH